MCLTKTLKRYTYPSDHGKLMILHYVFMILNDISKWYYTYFSFTVCTNLSETLSNCYVRVNSVISIGPI